MIIVGQQLKQLATRHSVVNNVEMSFDGNCLELTLADTVSYIEPPSDTPLRYGDSIPPEWLRREKLPNHLLLEKGDCVLACSREVVRIPLGYFGFIQTKGSLARHFVSVACFDGQVDTGYEGPITFEIVSHSAMRLIVPVGSPVASLFLFKCSTKVTPKYKGRYSNATGPTEPRIQ